MTMLKTFDLKGNKLSFADWISNLSPCETPFVSMVGKEKVDQTQYSWQTDRLAQPGKMGSTNTTVDPDKDDVAITADDFKEGAKFTSNNLHQTKVHTNFTQIFRKAVRVSDTTKKVSLYGRNSELGYQMEKAGMEIKRDLEHAILNSVIPGRPGTTTTHGVFDGFQNLVAPVGAKCFDTGAVVYKAVTYDWAAADPRHLYFTKEQVFDLTYNLYLAGSRANKIMFHPMHMSLFSDWVGSTGIYKSGATSIANPPGLHRMFDGLDNKYNALVKKIRDPLGQEFTLIPNRHMPNDMLFFFNEADWSQMVLREPEKITLAKMGSSEKQMIEFEVGLRHRNPFASGILKFTEKTKHSVDIQVVSPQNLVVPVGSTAESTVKVAAVIRQSNGATGPKDTSVTFTTTDETGVQVDTAAISTGVKAVEGDPFGFAKDTEYTTHDIKLNAAKSGKRMKVKAYVTAQKANDIGSDVANLDALISRD